MTTEELGLFGKTDMLPRADPAAGEPEKSRNPHFFSRLDPMFLADDLAGPAVPGGAPVLGRNDGFQAVELADALEAVVDQLPGAGPVGVDFAMFLGRAAAGAVEHAFGAAGDGADAAERGQHAVAAAEAFFGPDGLFFEDAEELGVQGGVDGLVGEAFGEGLHAGAAAEGDDGLVALDGGGEVLDELVLALPLDGGLFDLRRACRRACGPCGRRRRRCPLRVRRRPGTP